MALIMKLNKENNSCYADFENAYWRIENITAYENNKTNLLKFEFNCYPNKDSTGVKYKTTQQLNFGGSTESIYKPVLYTWIGEFKLGEVFSESFPTNTQKQKEILYPFIKEYLGLTEAKDC